MKPRPFKQEHNKHYSLYWSELEGPVPGSEIPPSQPIILLQIPLSRHATSQFPAPDFFSNTVQRYYDVDVDNG